MSRMKDVSIQHPVSAASKNIPKGKEIISESNKIFDKIDKESVTIVENTNKNSLKNIKELIFYGSLSKVVEIDGFSFKIRTLSNSEARDLTKKLLKMSDEEKLSDSNTWQVAIALEEINGLSIEEAYLGIFGEDNDIKTTQQKCFDIISNMNNHFVSRLMDEYFILSTESNKLFKLPNSKDKESAENLNK